MIRARLVIGHLKYSPPSGQGRPGQVEVNSSASKTAYVTAARQGCLISKAPSNAAKIEAALFSRILIWFCQYPEKTHPPVFVIGPTHTLLLAWY